MKRSIIAFFSLIFILSSLITPVYADGRSWFVTRNGQRQPIFSEEQKSVCDYSGYYMDTRVSDDSDEKVLYLTFDFGYENGNVERIRRALKDKGVPAAFFILDHPIINNTELIKNLAEDGHLLCNHTKSHKNLCNASKDEIKKDIEALEDIYRDYTGLELARYFRFPEGKYSYESMRVIEELGYNTVFWSFAYDDWDNNRQPSADKAIKKIISNTHNGAVILLHPTSSVNADILPTLIDTWRDMGYTFGTLDQLTDN